MNVKSCLSRTSATEYLSLLVLCLIIGTVFVVTDSLPDETETIAGKRYWFAGALSLAFFCFIPVVRRTGPFFKLTVTDLLFTLFALYYLTYTFFVPPVSAGRFRFGVALFVCWFYFRLFTAAYGNRKLIFFVVAAGLIEAVWGIGQYSGWLPAYHRWFGISGSFFNPGPYAGFLAILFPLVLAPAIKNRNVTERWCSGERKSLTQEERKNAVTGLGASLIAGLLTIALTMAESRTAWIAATAGSIPLLWKGNHVKKKIHRCVRRKPIKAAVTGLLLLCLAGMATVGLYRLKKESAEGRLLLWKISSQALVSEGAAGTGGFPAAYGKAQAAYFGSGQGTPTEKEVAGCPEYAFNEYFQIGIETGLAGLLLFLAAFLSAFFSCYSDKNGVAGALLSFLFFAAASYPLSVLPTCILTALLPAMAPTGKKGIRLPSLVLRVPLWLSGLFLFTWLPELYGQYRAEKKWDRLRSRYETGYYDRVDEYRPIYPELRENPAFLFEYGYALSQNKCYEESTRILKQGTRLSCDPMFYNIIGKNYQCRQATDRAAACYRYAAALVPGRAYPLYLLTLLYRQEGNRALALHYGRLLLDLQPKVDSPAVKEMKSEIRQWIKQIHPRPADEVPEESFATFTGES